MESGNEKVKLSSSQGKMIQYPEQGDLAFQLLVKSQLLDTPIDIKELMTYCLTPVPHALGTPDGFMAKTVKSKMVSVLLKDVSCEINNELDHGSILFIEHGHARLYVLTDIPETFKRISLKLLNQLPQHGDVIFSTDMYLRDSVKCQERQRRGCGDTLLIEGINTRRPADFKSFLKNDLNKQQLFALMHKVWQE